MKRVVVFCLLCCLACGVCTTAKAQKEKSTKEKILTTVVDKADKWGIGKKIPGWNLIKGKVTGRMTLVGLSFGYGNLALTAPPYENNLPVFDGGDQWDIKLKVIFSRNKQFSIHTGLGYESNTLRFHDNMDYSGQLIPVEERMVARYITVPLMFRYKTTSKFWLHGGVLAGVNFNTSHTGDFRYYSLVDTDNNLTTDYRTRVDCNYFNRFKLDLQAGITLYHITLFAKYGLVDMFNNNTDLSCHPLSLGVSLGI